MKAENKKEVPAFTSPKVECNHCTLEEEVEASTIFRVDDLTSPTNEPAEHFSLSAFFLCFRTHEAITSFLANAPTASLLQALLRNANRNKKPPALDWR